MAGIDSQVGRNIQRFRASMFSQTELAKLMRDRGWKWTQPTVVAVENGDRPLKIAEGIDLADILKRPMSDLVASSDVVAEVLELAREMTRADANLRAAFASYEGARFNLALTLDNVPSEKMTGRLRVVGESWVERTLSRALAEYAQEDIADAEADRIRSGHTPEEREKAVAQYLDSIAGEWQRKLHKANHGEH